ncbi:MAG: SDR family oxidoreductase [Planctomycetaceae bacterium]|nr:SDR family oxidoreductase [Planctomycetaceae bacterium]
MDLRIAGNAAVVVGGISGIGRACVEAFREENVRVAVWDIASDDHLPEDVLYVPVDVTDEAAVVRAAERTQEHFQGIRHLVHAAAIGSGRFGFPFTNLSPADWDRVLNVNIRGTVNVAHAVAPLMSAAGNGTMVFVASVAAQIGSPTDPPYSASKAANINFAQVMARDLAAAGVRVNTVCPGMVRTPLNQSVWRAWNDRQAEENRKSYNDWASEKIRQLIPLNRWQEPADIADMILFLSSDRSRQVTGQTINVDGGYVMHW